MNAGLFQIPSLCNPTHKSEGKFSKIEIMRKYLFLLIIIISFPQCQKDYQVPKIELNTEILVNSSSLQDDLGIELKTIINSIALSLLDLGETKEFRKLVHQLVAKRFDGDENTLFKHISEKKANLPALLFQGKTASDKRKIFTNYSVKVNLLTKSFSDFSTFKKIENGYKLGNNKLYPQIYIPYFETFEHFYEIAPTIAMVINDDELIQGYKLEKDGSISIVDVNHAYAKENLVWIVSVNDRIDENGGVDKFISQKDQDQKGGLRANSYRAKVSAIKLYSPHESWGRSEIYLAAMHGDAGCNGYTPQTFYGWVEETNRMNVLFNIPLTRGTSFFTGDSEQNRLTIGECIDFIIFEKDNGGSVVAHYNYLNCTNSAPLTVQSYSGPYFQGRVCYPFIASQVGFTWDNDTQVWDIPGECYMQMGSVRFD